MNRDNEFKLGPMRHKDTINEKLDDALAKSFPASDPVSLGQRSCRTASVSSKEGRQIAKGFGRAEAEEMTGPLDSIRDFYLSSPGLIQ